MDITRKPLIVILPIIILILLSGCGADVSDVKIDYGQSSVYSKSDMDSAIDEILKEFKTWDGYKLYSISYTNDEWSQGELDYCNKLCDGENFDECIVFKSSFHTPKNNEGGLSPDRDYSGYTWILARTCGGKWTLVAWGYG